MTALYNPPAEFLPSKTAERWRTVPADVIDKLTSKTEIPLGNGNSPTKVRAVEYEGLLLVLQSAMFGFGSGATFYVLGDPASWTGPVTDCWNDGFSRAENNPHDEMQGVRVRHGGRIMVIVGLATLIRGLPSTDAGVTLKEVQDDWKHPGYGLSVEISKGATQSYHQVGPFVYVRHTYNGKTENYLHYRSTDLRRDYISDDLLSILTKEQSFADASGQLSLF